MKKNILFLGLYTLLVISVLTYMGNPKISDKYSPMFKSALTQSIQKLDYQKPLTNNQHFFKLNNIQRRDTTETFAPNCPPTYEVDVPTCYWETCAIYNTCNPDPPTCYMLYTCANQAITCLWILTCDNGITCIPDSNYCTK
jgi:hypothetical protein